MRVETLPSPGPIGVGLELRNKAASAISYVEVVAARTANGKSDTAKSLGAFFAACKTACDAVTDTTVPTVTARQVRASAPTKVELTFSEVLDGTITPAAAAFALATPSKTITSVLVSGNKVFLTVSAAYVEGDLATATVAYTKPGTNQLRDPSDNEVASFTAAAIVWVA